jgi:hypothetical protein
MPTNKRYHVEEATMPVYSTKFIIDKAENQHLKYMDDIVELLNIYEDAIRQLRDALEMARNEYEDLLYRSYYRHPQELVVLNDIDEILAKYDETVPNDLTPEQQNVKDLEGEDE